MKLFPSLRKLWKKIEVGFAMKWYVDLYMLGTISRTEFLNKIDCLEALIR